MKRNEMVLWLVPMLTACIGQIGEYDEATDSWDDESAGETVDALASFAQAGTPSSQHSVTFARDLTESATGLAIRQNKHSHPKAIYSVAVPGLSTSEQIRLHAEVTISRCNKKDIAGLSGDKATTPCTSPKMKSKPYGYNPRISAAVVLTDGPKDTTGMRVSPWFDMTCTEGRHHCALAIPEVRVDDLPTAQGKFLNLVVTADAAGANAQSWHVMEVEQHKGGLHVTRLGPGWNKASAKQTTKLLVDKTMPLDQPAEDGDPTQVKRIVYQLKLTGLQPGDVVGADARMRAVLDYGGSCDPLISGTLILTEDPKARQPHQPDDKVVAVKNGKNCTDHSSGGCKYIKSGAVRLGKATPSTMYLSYIAMGLRTCIQPGDKWHIRGSDGFVKATVFR